MSLDPKQTWPPGHAVPPLDEGICNNWKQQVGYRLCSKDHEILNNGLSALLCTIIASSLGGGSLGRPATSGFVRSCGGLMNSRV